MSDVEVAMSSVSSADLIDVSFAGAIVTIDAPDGSIAINNFMDDANPVEFPDVTVTGYGVNCNGIMIRWAKPTAILMSVTVIPGSEEDLDLYDLFNDFHVTHGVNKSEKWGKAISATIHLEHVAAGYPTAYNFYGGTFVSGPPGPSASGDGKMRGRTYTFAFSYCTR